MGNLLEKGKRSGVRPLHFHLGPASCQLRDWAVTVASGVLGAFREPSALHTVSHLMLMISSGVDIIINYHLHTTNKEMEAKRN